ncbi:co-chaperone GroES [Candidatus Liberibacter africanus]|uniref:Co-chaperonin GroES n=1 Tax=Candidatus Liberibacter africanus PTSAPSY TaxID=1277257 RepID=A0A0G3I3F1_LIBAF|nr:co-chaperone GroES [Candidatus Liberibacter africanus]AKK19790.1 co-chaperonin GroES [Candidatus Liberibacter africanus PTSAPSY]QTP63658.1 co-chaperone GroES [Candidatus Liberibacter africanus]
MVGKRCFRPSRGRVVVRRVQCETMTESGLIIPDTVSEKPSACGGEVVWVGAGVLDQTGKVIEPEVNPGDVVLFGKWSGTEIKLGGDEEYLVMQESDIIGVVVEDK